MTESNEAPSAADVRREFLYARYGQPEMVDAPSALQAIGVTELLPEQVVAFRYRDQEAADAYAAANLEHHGLSVLGTYMIDGSVVGVLDLRPALSKRDERTKKPVSDFAPPPLRPDESLFWVMAIRNGQLYAAPLGTPYDLDVSEAWIRVNSIDDLRKFFGAGS